MSVIDFPEPQGPEDPHAFLNELEMIKHDSLMLHELCRAAAYLDDGSQHTRSMLNAVTDVLVEKSGKLEKRIEDLLEVGLDSLRHS